MIDVILTMLLMLDGPKGEPPGMTAEQRYEELAKEFTTAEDRFFKARRQATTEQDIEKVRNELYPDPDTYAARFRRIIVEQPESRGALDASIWILTHATTAAAADEAIAQVARRGTASDQLGDACLNLAWYEQAPAESLLRAILEKNPHRDVKGRAAFSLAQRLKFRAERPGFEASPGAAKRPEVEAEELFDRVIAEFGDVGSGRQTLGEFAKIFLSDMHTVGTGKPAPEIDGEDAYGHRFKLSDFRGKVLAINFSGNWCGPCRAMYPKERELVKRMAGRPFVLLGINTDSDKASLRKSIEAGEITWRCWWIGNPEGPISKQWHVHQYPTSFVIDREGKIRYSDVRGDELDEAVEALLRETVKKAKP
jgi:peroxiredoxin